MASRIIKKIQKIEDLNYGLYILISILLGVVFFSSTFFAGSYVTEKVVKNGMDVTRWNEEPVDSLFKVQLVDGRGFDLSLKSSEKVKVRYYLGSMPETLTFYSESDGFVLEHIQQFRSNIPNKVFYIQVEVEKENGEISRSTIQEISNNMVK